MSFTPDRSGFVDVPGARIAWRSTGSGRAMIMIHAGIADQSMWDDDIPALTAGHQVVTYDTRGYGATTESPTAFSNRADCIAVLDHLGIDRAVVLGVSRGGHIALDTAIEYPDRIAGLIVVNGGLGGGLETEPTPEELALFESEEPLYEARDWAGIADLDVRLWVDGVGQPADRVPLAIRERVRTMSLANYVAEHPEGEPIVLDPPAAGRLADVRVPTLVIVGELDTTGTRAAMNAVAAGIDGARLVIMPGVAHLPNLEQPERFRALVLELLDAVDALAA
jgi:pimeloyl-ACP methyl ester carboxylesterase